MATFTVPPGFLSNKWLLGDVIDAGQQYGRLQQRLASAIKQGELSIAAQPTRSEIEHLENLIASAAIRLELAKIAYFLGMKINRELFGYDPIQFPQESPAPDAPPARGPENPADDDPPIPEERP